MGRWTHLSSSTSMHLLAVAIAMLLDGTLTDAWMSPSSSSLLLSRSPSQQDQPTTAGTSTIQMKATTTSSSSTSSSSSSSSSSSLSELMNGPMTWTTIVGEADRAFRQGIQLEKAGQPRSANRALHEAATLYQCVLEGKEKEEGEEDDATSLNPFAHVTSLSLEDCRSLLGYILVKLGFLARESLSSANAAIRLYTMATEIDPQPSAVAYHGIGLSLEADGGNGKDLQHLEKAVDAYRTAMNLFQKNGKHRPDNLFALAVALERLGNQKNTEEAESILTQLQRSEAPISCLVDSWGYVRWHSRKIAPVELNLYRGTRDMIKLALEYAMPLIIDDDTKRYNGEGLVCEFGVGSGKSLRMTQELLPLDVPIHGFDTFTGLPHAWGTEPVGAYSTGGIAPIIEGDVHFHKGLFGNTITPFLEDMDNNDGNKSHYLAYANIDCDLYTSTLDILEGFHGRIVKGTILIFDEYICHPTWRQDEFRAFRECCTRFGWKYEYLAFSLATKQAVVRVTEA